MRTGWPRKRRRASREKGTPSGAWYGPEILSDERTTSQDPVSTKGKARAPSPELPKPPTQLVSLACPRCGRLIKDASALERHLAKHERADADKDEPCPICGEMLVRRADGLLCRREERSGSHKRWDRLIDAKDHFASAECRNAQRVLEYEHFLGPLSEDERMPQPSTAAGLSSWPQLIEHRPKRRARNAYIVDLNDSMIYARHRFTGETQAGPRKKANLDVQDGAHQAPDDQIVPPFTVPWTAEECNRFFYALSRCSRLRTDLIAEHVATRTVAEVDAYLRLLAAHADKEPPLLREDVPAALEVSNAWIQFEERQAALIVQREERNLRVGRAEGGDPHSHLSWRHLCLLGEDVGSEYEEDLDAPVYQEIRGTRSRGRGKPSDQIADSVDGDVSVEGNLAGRPQTAANGLASYGRDEGGVALLSNGSEPLNLFMVDDSLGLMNTEETFDVPEHDGPISPSKAALANSMAQISLKTPGNGMHGLSIVQAQEHQSHHGANLEGVSDARASDAAAGVNMDRAQTDMLESGVTTESIGLRHQLLNLHAVGALLDAYCFAYTPLGIPAPEGCISSGALLVLENLVCEHVRTLVLRISRYVELRHAGHIDSDSLSELTQATVRDATLDGTLDAKNNLLSLRSRLFARARLANAHNLAPAYETCPHCREILFAPDIDDSYQRRVASGERVDWLQKHLQKCRKHEAVLEPVTMSLPRALWSTATEGLAGAYETVDTCAPAPIGAIALPHVFRPEPVMGSVSALRDPDIELDDLFDVQAEQQERWEEVHLHHKERTSGLEEEARLWRHIAGTEGPSITLKARVEWLDEAEAPPPGIGQGSLKAKKRSRKQRKISLDAKAISKEIISTSDEDF